MTYSPRIAAAFSLVLLSAPVEAATLVFFDDFTADSRATYRENAQTLENFSIRGGQVDVIRDGQRGLPCPSGGCLVFAGDQTFLPIPRAGVGIIDSLQPISFIRDAFYEAIVTFSGDQSPPVDDSSGLSFLAIGGGAIGRNVRPETDFGFQEAVFRFSYGADLDANFALGGAGDPNTLGLIIDSIEINLVDNGPVAAVSLPATFLLFLSGLSGLIFLRIGVARRALSFAAALGCLFVFPSYAATAVVDEAGNLNGFRDISFVGLSFNIDFIDGRCVDIFDGCDDTPDDFFGGTSLGGPTPIGGTIGIRNFLEFFLDEVLVDGPFGNFDTEPSLISGCENELRCDIAFPTAATSTRVAAFIVINEFFVDQGDGVFLDGVSGALADFRNTDFITYGKVTENTPTVPLPPGIALLPFGIAALALLRARATRRLSRTRKSDSRATLRAS